MAFERIRQIDYSGVIDIAQVLAQRQWPPQAMVQRHNRMGLYQELFDGDWHGLNVDDLEVQVNYFKRLPVGLADLLSMSPPATGRPDLDEAVSEATYDGVVSLLRSGGCLFWTDPGTGDISVLDPRWWFPGVDGSWIYGVPVLSPATGQADTLAVRHWRGGVYTEAVYKYEGASLGAELASRQFNMRNDTLALVAARPTVAGWGTSLADAVASATVEISHRYTANSAVLDKLVKPMLSFRVATAELPDIEPDISDEDTWLEVQAKVDSVFSGLADHEAIELQDEVQNVEALTWDPRLGPGMDQIEGLQGAVEMLASMPGLHTGFSEVGMSGVALKRILIPLYATSRSVQIRLLQGLNASLRAAGVSARVDWPHPFDVLEEAGEVEDDERIIE